MERVSRSDVHSNTRIDRACCNAVLPQLVVLFPQTSTAGVYGAGCWDWAGKISSDFDTKRGIQLRAVTLMLADLANIIM